MPTPIRDLSGKKVLVTGAASGIGRATAILLDELGAELVLTDIQSDLLDDVVAAINASAHPGRVLLHDTVDVADYDRVARFAEDVAERVGRLDVVMNIAGISAWGTIDRLDHKKWQAMVDVNLMGPIHILEQFVPPMIAAGGPGHVVNVSSAAGILALPWHAAYSAAKFGLVGVSEVLRFDLREHNIGVSVVVPGGVKTPLVDTVDITGLNREHPKVQAALDGFHKVAVEPEAVARAIVAGIYKNKFMVFTSNDIRLGYFAKQKLGFPYEIAMRIANDRFSYLSRVSEGR